MSKLLVAADPVRTHDPTPGIFADNALRQAGSRAAGARLSKISPSLGGVVSSSTSTSKASPEASSGRGPLVLILAIIGILGILAGILYLAGVANSIHVMVGSVHHGSHQVRAIVSFVIGILFLVGAFFARSGSGSGSSGSQGGQGNS
jgi:hypothetical protein